MIKNLVDEAVYKEVIERIDSIDDNSNRLWGKMTPHQMISHLVDQFELLKGNNDFKYKKTFVGVYIYKYLFLYIFNFPKAKVKIGKKYDKQNGGGSPLTSMQNDKEKLKEELTKYFKNPIVPSSVNHPFFGPLNQEQWGIFAFKHIDHHLRQFNS